MNATNRRAFLTMTAVSEGTLLFGKENGYDVLVGGGLFTSFTDHPRKLIDLGHGLKSTAAGRYQILARTFDDLKPKLKLKDFSPDSQDACAIQLIKERKALDDVDTGRIYSAIGKCCKIWASFPGAGYNQHENKLQSLITAYQNAGGKVSA